MRIVVAVDPNDQSFTKVVDAAEKLAANASTMSIVHVFPPPVVWASDALSALRDQTIVERERVKTAIKSRMPVALASASVDVVLGENTHAGDDLVAYAAQAQADLLVIATRGNIWRGFFVGSVAERVVRRAHCDVYVVRAPRGADEAS